MLYAVVDIETTGGYAAANGITEIAVRISDGKKIISTIEFLEFAPIKLPKKQCKIEINIVILKALFLIFTYNNFS